MSPSELREDLVREFLDQAHALLESAIGGPLERKGK